MTQAPGHAARSGWDIGRRHGRFGLALGDHPAPRPQGAVGMTIAALLGFPEAVHEVELAKGKGQRRLAAPAPPCGRPGGACGPI